MNVLTRWGGGFWDIRCPTEKKCFNLLPFQTGNSFSFLLLLQTGNSFILPFQTGNSFILILYHIFWEKTNFIPSPSHHIKNVPTLKPYHFSIVFSALNTFGSINFINYFYLSPKIYCENLHKKIFCGII